MYFVSRRTDDMYSTTFSHEKVALLRSLGYIHFTGLHATSEDKPLSFPKDFWGKSFHDGLGAVVAVFRNGEIWFKYGNCASPDDLALKLEDISELERMPLNFNIHSFLNNLQPAWLALRVAEPYYDFQGSCPPDPNLYV